MKHALEDIGVTLAAMVLLTGYLHVLAVILS